MSDSQKWLNKVPTFLTFFLVIALGMTLANLLWLVLTPAPKAAQAAVLSNTTQKTIIPKQNYGKLIADQHIFGAVPKVAPKATPVAKPKPKPKPKPVVKKLNLKLHGIIASSKDGNGFAIISYNRKSQESYKRGEELPKKEADKERELKGVTLKRVDATSVVIDNNGTEQILELAEFDKSKSQTSARKNARSAPARDFRSVPNRAPSAPKEPAPNEQNKIGNLAELREALLADSNVINTVLKPSLVRENGQVTGVRVYPGSNRPLFRALGFRNGDIVKSVNGTVIDGSPSNLALLQQFADSPSLEITVLRGGNETILTPTF